MSSTAAAGPRESAWYADLGMGVDFAADQDLDDSGSAAEFDLGRPSLSVALGYRINPAWSLEAELAYRSNDLEVLYWPDEETSVSFDHDDSFDSTSVMLNALRHFQLGAFAPYLGGGIGMAQVRWRMAEGPVGWGPNRIPREPILDDDTGTLAVQLIAGFELALSRHWGFAADYRLWHAPDFSMTGADGADYDLSHTTNSFQLHLRYLFSGDWLPASGVPTPADGGWFFGAGTGVGYAADSEASGSIENLDAFQGGPVARVFAGYDFARHWRVEIGVEQRENDAEVVDFNPETGQFPASGSVRATSLMAGVAYRFRPEKAVRPFIGGSIGAAWLDYDVETLGAPYLDDSATSPAFELLAGIDMALTRRLNVVTDLRSWYASPVKLDRPDGSAYETWHWVHSIGLGLRYSF